MVLPATCRLLLCVLLLSASLAAAAQRADSGDLFQPCTVWPAQELDGALQRFSTLLTFQTVHPANSSSSSSSAELDSWQRLDSFLQASYPDVFAALGVEVFPAAAAAAAGDAASSSSPHGVSYLFTWPGSVAQLAPVLFISHSDVVPVAAATEAEWTHPPFGGVIADGYVWGRGALDVKVLLALQLESIRVLLAEGFRPVRTLLFACGHDEEVGGAAGAAAIEATLRQRGVRLAAIVDEGSAIALDGLPPLYRRPVALVATAEKLALTVEVTLRSPGGHASMPPTDGSSVAAQLGRLLAAMQRRPPPLKLVPPTSDFVAGLTQLPLPPGLGSWVVRAVARASRSVPALRWLLAAALARAQPETAAMVRTTVALTRLQAGTADNVLPQLGTVGFNVRLLPGDTPDTARALVAGWLGADAATASISTSVGSSSSDGGAEEEVQMRVANASGPHFRVLASAIQQAWRPRRGGGDGQEAPLLPVLPVLMPAMTDSRHYLGLLQPGGGALRFTPWAAWRADYTRLHGVDERLRVGDFACGLQTYKAALQGFGRLLQGDEEDEEVVVEKQEAVRRGQQQREQRCSDEL